MRRGDTHTRGHFGILNDAGRARAKGNFLTATSYMCPAEFFSTRPDFLLIGNVHTDTSLETRIEPSDRNIN